MYPFVQLGKSIQVNGEEIEILYPVGVPTVEVFDEPSYPCNLHWRNPLEPCSCSYTVKLLNINKKLVGYPLVMTQPADPHAYLANFFGIICVDVTPPNNLYHPVLPTFNKKEGKCLFSLDPIVKQCFTSVELSVAVRAGYCITKIYRADRYKAQGSLWRGLLSEIYKLKLYNSQSAEPNSRNIFNETKEEWQQRQKQEYHDKFNLDLDFNDWASRPAAKMTGKILMNSGWGKHAESVDHNKVKIISNIDAQGVWNFCESVEKRQSVVSSFTSVSDSRMMFRYAEARNGRSIVYPDLHKGYLPCAVFVPMYGRLMLWNELNQLGERVIMCDTDSVKYVADPSPEAYTIKPGDTLGDWELEDGDIEEFIAIGPKSYGCRYANGKKTFKCKGISIRRAHEDLINFDVAKRILLEGEKIKIPQQTVDYIPGDGLFFRKFLKALQFHPRYLKGVYDPVTTQLYPFGYTRST